MAEKKHEFEVVDKRKFTSEGEVRPDVSESPKEEAAQSIASQPGAPEEPVATIPEPPTHSSEDHAAGRTAYASANRGMDEALRQSGMQFEVSFDRFLTQLYMTALFQLGMLREENAPAHVDLIGARQTIDTIEMLGQKTKGNLTEAEGRFLQDRLYELHMAYLDVTSAIARQAAETKSPIPDKK